MADNDKKPSKTDAATQDELSKRIVELEKRVTELVSENELLNKGIEATREGAKDVQKKLQKCEKALAEANRQLSSKAEAPSPDDMTACVGGRLIHIERTVQAKFALDEVKKGFLEEDLELLVPKRA